MKTLDAYAKSRVRAILRALEKYHQFQETDSLHRIRVEVKKLKATLLILQYADKKFKAHQAYLPLRNIFRKAGQIRQPTVMFELLMAHNMEGLPVERLGDSQKARDRFRADTPFFMTQVKRTGRSLKTRWKKVRRKDISGYVKILQRQIQGTFVPRLKAAELHTTRKRLKQVVYLSRLTKRVPEKEVRFYARLEAAIGSLHDKQVLLEFLRTLPRRTVAVETGPIRRQATLERRAIGKMAAEFYNKQ